MLVPAMHLDLRYRPSYIRTGRIFSRPFRPANAGWPAPTGRETAPRLRQRPIFPAIVIYRPLPPFIASLQRPYAGAEY